MEPDADLAAIGRLIGDPNRAQVLQLLLGGEPRSGSALAAAAGISRALASAHLKKLTAGGLVRAETRGRQQLYSIAAQPVAEALTARGAIGDTDGAWVLGPQGTRLFGDLGIDAASVPHRTRPLLRPCLDWTERRSHLAGGLGAALTAEFSRRKWVRRVEGTRIVTLTPAGSAGLGEWLGLDLGQLRAAAAA
jgi:DNA-binding transcriptional ArsR family regulator